MIGVQSFGGGSATLYLIRRVSVDRRAWLSDEEFTRYWGICQIAPGINILGLVSLIGWRVAGAPGAILSLIGLLMPSASITIAITSIYSIIRDVPIVRRGIAGVVPATVGLGLLLSFTMVRPLLSAAQRDGALSTAVAAMLLLASTIINAVTKTPVLAIIWGAGAFSGFTKWGLAARRKSSQ